MDQPVAYLRGEWGSGPHHFKFDSRDLSKNPMKFFKQGVFPHLRKFEGSARILDTPRGSANGVRKKFRIRLSLFMDYRFQFPA